MSRPILFKNITVVTPDETDVVVIPSCYVMVSGTQYRYVGTSGQEAVQSISGNDYDIYDGTGRILLPAFANAHTHLAMTLMRNRADDTTLHKWLFDRIFPLEEKMRSQDLNSGTILGICEMIKNGIGACANMYMTREDAMDAQAGIDAGIKMNTVINGGAQDPSSGEFLIDKPAFDDCFNRFHNAADGRIQCGVLVHSIYLYDEEYYYGLAELAQSRNTFVHVHLSETQKEVEDCLLRYGMRPPVILEKMGLFRVPVLAAHCVFLDDQDREILRRNDVTMVHNPSSNLKLGSGIADLKKALDAGIRVALGTDGPASNNNLDMYREMRLASFLAKGTNFDASVISSQQIIRSATVDGMAGMGFRQSGKVAVGMDADLQILNTDTPGMTPLGDPIPAIVYSAGGSDVESLMVSGKMLMRKKELLTIDEEKALYEARQSADFIYR